MKKINPETDLASIEDCQYLIHSKQILCKKDNKLFWRNWIKINDLIKSLDISLKKY